MRGAHLAEGGGPLIPRWRDEVQGRNDVAADTVLKAHDVRVLEIQPPGQSLKGPGIGSDQARITDVGLERRRSGEPLAQFTLLVKEVGVDNAAVDFLTGQLKHRLPRLVNRQEERQGMARAILGAQHPPIGHYSQTQRAGAGAPLASGRRSMATATMEKAIPTITAKNAGT